MPNDANPNKLSIKSDLVIEGVKNAPVEKTIGQRLAERFGAEIVGEDAQQVTLTRGQIVVSMPLGDGYDAAEKMLATRWFGE